MCQESRSKNARIKELLEELNCEHLDVELRGGEADLWLSSLLKLQDKYRELEKKLATLQPSSPSSSDIHMGSTTSEDGKSGRSKQPEGSLIDAMGNASWDVPTRPASPMDDLDETTNASAEEVIRIAAARDDANILQEQEFRTAHHHTDGTGEHPKTSGSDRQCMVALVKVNGLEAYTLLDTGSTAVSITYDFACVAKLNVMQLGNPIPLQLGTVGSRSMINYRATAWLELGPASEDNAYLDVVNLDRYDMIIGIMFMCKHGLVLDFDQNVLSAWGTLVPTLTKGQEDLMLVKRQAPRGRAPIEPKGRPVRATH